MLTVDVDDSVIRARLNALPAKVLQKLEYTVNVLAQKLRNHVVSDKLMGQVLKRRTGRLGQSIQEKVKTSQTEVTGIVYSTPDVPYNRIQEYGGKTAAHVIEARNAQSLAFMMGGSMVFAKKVNHPGSLIPARSYMRSSLKDMREEIINRMKQAVIEGTV